MAFKTLLSAVSIVAALQGASGTQYNPQVTFKALTSYNFFTQLHSPVVLPAPTAKTPRSMRRAATCSQSATTNPAYLEYIT